MATAKQIQRARNKRRIEVFDQVVGLLAPGRLLDLGTGHGAFAVRAAERGWQVTAVDARSERWPDDARIEWVEADVREVAIDGYDLVACLGLLYHLPLADQLDLLARCAPVPLLLDTHVADGVHDHELSDPVDEDGYAGRYYEEPGRTTSSWGNERSFWPTLDSLRRMLHEAGYSTVMPVEPWTTGDRTYFLCLAPSAPRG